jgi:plasmid stabilization system protein ParE
MHIEILDNAKNDLYEGAIFYESQSYRLGDYFLDSIVSDIESLYIYAGIHSAVFEYYALRAKRFPYTIYYKIEDKAIKVYAVLDDRMEPKKTEKRLKEEE